MPAPGVSRRLRCQSPTQPALCALRRQRVAAVSLFVSHWRRVCATRKERLRLPPSAVTRSLTSDAAHRPVHCRRRTSLHPPARVLGGFFFIFLFSYYIYFFFQSGSRRCHAICAALEIILQDFFFSFRFGAKTAAACMPLLVRRFTAALPSKFSGRSPFTRLLRGRTTF